MKRIKFLIIAVICVLVLLAVLKACNSCSNNQSQGEAVTAADTIGLEEIPESIDVEQVFSEEPTVEVRKDGSKKKYPQGEWVIKNDVTKVKDIAIEDIADDIVVKPILTDEPIGHITGVSGNSNDFIGADGYGTTFYHIKDGRLVEKLHALGRARSEYSSQILETTYLPDDSLFFGCNVNQGKIMCFKTSPFKFVANYEISFLSQNNRVKDMIALGRDHFLLTWRQSREFNKVYDSCTIYEYDAHSNNLYNKGKFWGYDCSDMFMRSGNDVLISVLEEKTTLYRYVDGEKQKVATIDYGDKEMTKEKVEVKKDGVNPAFQPYYVISAKDHATGCHLAQLTDSGLVYWLSPVINGLVYGYLTIATRDKVQNYEIHIGGLKLYVYPSIADNGVYTMLIQGDWEKKINPDEKLSPVGKRIIEAMKGNDYDPVILQFRLKNKYLMNN